MSSTNDFGQAVGDPVIDWAPAPFPDVRRMKGRYCQVEPLLALHAEELYEQLCGDDLAPLWTWMAVEMPEDRVAFADHIERLAEATDRVTVVIRDGEGVASGLASYLRIDRENGTVEVGSVIYAPRLQRTAAATEAMYLLAKHVFELGYRRYEWKCDSLNTASKAAAERLGFVHEGRFRNAVVYKGRSRDTDWYSIIDSEWPVVAEAMRGWLDRENLPDGVQIKSLTQLRAELVRDRS